MVRLGLICERPLRLVAGFLEASTEIAIGVVWAKDGSRQASCKRDASYHSKHHVNTNVMDWSCDSRYGHFIPH